MMVERPHSAELAAAYTEAFRHQHQVEFGFNFEARAIHIDTVRVRSVGQSQTIHPSKIEHAAPDEIPVPLK